MLIFTPHHGWNNVLSILSDYVEATRLSTSSRFWMAPVALIRICISRIFYGIGPRFYMLFEFYRVPMRQWGNYLLDEGLRPILRTINHAEIRDVVDSKILFHNHCLKNDLATAPILLGFQVNDEGRLDFDNYQLQCLTFPLQADDTQNDDFFCKRVSGSWGQGSFRFKLVSGQRLCQDKITQLSQLAEILKRDAGKAPGEWIIQPVITVHKDLDRITSSHGLSTVRVISVLHESQVILLAAMLRITVGTNAIDNFSAGQTGNLVASINLTTGRLGRCRGSVSREFPMIKVFERHPDTGNIVEGFLMPYWEELKELVILAHQSLPRFSTLAWDVAVTERGPMIIEANPTYDVSGMQVAHGDGFKPLLFRYLKRLRPEAFN